ncbi:MAG: helix-turn-helix domain-containing protein [Sphingomonadaceae bacterium]
MLGVLHREDIKAEIRKRFGSVRAFEAAHSLPDKSVSDLMRGRRSRRVERAIADLLSTRSPSNQSDSSDHSGRIAPSHPKNEGVV